MVKRVVGLAMLTGIAVAFTFLIASAFPKASAAGLPDAGVLVEWIVALLRAATDTSASVVLGLGIYLVFVMTDEQGRISRRGMQRLALIRRGVWLWIALVAIRMVVGLAEELGIPISQALDPTYIRSYLSQTSVGRYVLAQMLFLALAALLLYGARSWARTFFALLAIALAVIMPVLNGHSAGSGNHSLALGTISLHVWAISAWIGVLVGLWLDRHNFEVVAPRASHVALIAALIVVFSGIVNGAVRLTTWSDLGSGYGRVLIAKSVLFIALISLAARIRRRALDIGALKRVIALEAVLMIFTIGVGATLARLEPPVPRDLLAQSPAEALTGNGMLAEPTLRRLLTTFSFDGFSLALIAAMTITYLIGVRALRRRGDSWSVASTLLYLIGVVALFFATNGGLAAYAKLAFSWHMVAHMVIVSIAPIGIILGAPVTLALRTLPSSRDGKERGLRGHLQAALNSRTLSLVSHPLWALMVFDASLFALYFTNAFASLMRWHLGHTLMDLHFLAVGLLFFYVIVGVDPNPRRTPHLVRIVLLLVAMSLHAFFSVALMSTDTLIDGGYFAELQRPWAIDLLADQQMGGSLGWGLGEVPIVLALIATFIQWVRSDNREARRLDRAAARAEARGEDDELTRYNAYLQRLSDQDRRNQDPTH